MSDDELVKRLQVGHDPHCAMSYGMHEHCCDCSYPCRQEAVETINKLRQDLAAARALLYRAYPYVEDAQYDSDEMRLAKSTLLSDIDAALAGEKRDV